MKKNIIYFLAIFAICSFMTSCSVQYMQIATLKSEQVTMQSDGSFTSQHSEFTLKYDFWSYPGEVVFLVSNNSDKDLYLNLEKSFFINNGFAYDYYQNRTFIHSNKSSISTSNSSSTGAIKEAGISGQTLYGLDGNVSLAQSYNKASSYSTHSEIGKTVEYKENKVVCIPAHSSKTFNEFNLYFDLYRECGFPRNPSKDDIVILEFAEDNSPKVFENRLMFIMDDKEIPINHKFYVCELENIRKDKTSEQILLKDCNGNDIYPYIFVNKKASPNRYYLHYNFSFNGYHNDRINKK